MDRFQFLSCAFDGSENVNNLFTESGFWAALLLWFLNVLVPDSIKYVLSQRGRELETKITVCEQKHYFSSYISRTIMPICLQITALKLPGSL
jgi:hypothetical protein